MKKLVIVLTVLLIAVSASAGSRDGQLGIHGIFDYATVSMSDVNSTLSPLNSISQALGGGGAVTYGFTPNIEGGLAVDYIYSGSTNSNIEGSTYNLTLNAPLLEVAVTGGYVWPDVTQNLDLKVNLGIAYESLNGSMSTTIPGYPSPTYTSSGVGVLLTVGAEYFLTRQFSASLDLGYRYASLSPIATSTGGNWKTSGGSDAAADFSGLALKVSLAYYFDLSGKGAVSTTPVVPNTTPVTPAAK